MNSTNKWIVIGVIAVLVVAAYAYLRMSHHTPAQFSFTKEVEQLSSDHYQVMLHIKADKGILPKQLCLIVAPDMKPVGRMILWNTDTSVGSTNSVSPNYACLSDPSRDITAAFRFDHDINQLSISLNPVAPK